MLRRALAWSTVGMLLASACGSPPKPPPVEAEKKPPPIRTPEAHKALQEALALHQAGDQEGAWAKLEPLFAAGGKDPDLQRIACRVAAARTPPAVAPAREHCALAEELLPTDPWPAVALAFALEATKDDDTDGAITHAREKLAAAPTTPEPPADAWQTLAGIHQRRHQVTWAEEAAKQGTPPGSDTILAWATLTRHRYGLPADASKFGVGPEREAGYVNAVQSILDEAQADAVPAAKEHLKLAATEYPDSPGVSIALCDIEVRSGHIRPAFDACMAALRSYEESSWAHYLLGILQQGGKHPVEARKHFERAIELDATTDDAWVRLAVLLRAAKDQAALDALGPRYQTQFGRPLP